MSQRRAVNRIERRQMNQELYLIRRELEDARASQEEETAASESAETAAARRFADLLTWTLRLVTLADENRASIIALRGEVETLKKNQDTLLEVATTTTTGFDLDFRLTALRPDVDSISASVSRARSISHRFSKDAATLTCNDCGARFQNSHSCGGSRTRGCNISASFSGTGRDALTETR
jgi:hypothetical protein